MNRFTQGGRHFLLLLIAFSLSHVVWGATILDEKFDDPNLIGTDWVVVDEPPQNLSDKGPSNWSIANGVLTQTSNIWGDPTDQVSLGTFIVWQAGPDLRNLAMEFDITANDDDGMGMVWRWKDRLNHYRFMTVLDPGSRGPFRRIERRLGDGAGDKFPYYENGAQGLARTEEAYVNGETIRMRVEVIDDTHTVFWNGKKILEAKSDDGPFVGKIGFALYAQQVNIDNLIVEDLGGLSVEPGSKLAVTWGSLKTYQSR